MNNVNAYDYYLPKELIAYYPLEDRGASKMLVVDRRKQSFVIKQFSDIVDYMNIGDCFVINNTKVLKARIFGKKDGVGAKVEAMLLSPLSEDKTLWKCFIKPGKRVKNGIRIKLFSLTNEKCLKQEWCTVVNKHEDGTFGIKFDAKDINSIFENYGNMPLPPYIKREATVLDDNIYQTVYSKIPGAVAAPTAGLHFTNEVLRKLQEKGVNKAELTLHVGAGTFQPISVEKIEDHKMHSEEYFMSKETANLVNNTKQNGKKILAVGTTTTRVLEALVDNNGLVQYGFGRTNIFIYPPYQPKVVDMLLTNFHLPKSTLLMLVSAFATSEIILDAYKFAIKENFRFYSYGDCMLLI